MFSGYRVQREGILVNHHRSISADVHPTGIRVALDDAMLGAEEPGRVHFMEPRYGKFQQIDLVARQHVLQDGTGRYGLRGDAADVLAFLVPVLMQLHRLHFAFVQAQGLGDPPGGSDGAEEIAEALGITGRLIEQHRRPGALAVAVDELDDGTHFDIPTGPLHLLQFASFLDCRQEFAQVPVIRRHCL